MDKSHQLSSPESEVTLEDFVIPSKVTAFCAQYSPSDHWTEGCDTYTDYQLRSYFKAIVCPLGDPLSIYLQLLAREGFLFHSDVCGEPVIYCLPK